MSKDVQRLADDVAAKRAKSNQVRAEARKAERVLAKALAEAQAEAQADEVRKAEARMAERVQAEAIADDVWRLYMQGIPEREIQAQFNCSKWTYFTARKIGKRQATARQVADDAEAEREARTAAEAEMARKAATEDAERKAAARKAAAESAAEVRALSLRLAAEADAAIKAEAARKAAADAEAERNAAADVASVSGGAPEAHMDPIHGADMKTGLRMTSAVMAEIIVSALSAHGIKVVNNQINRSINTKSRKVRASVDQPVFIFELRTDWRPEDGIVTPPSLTVASAAPSDEISRVRAVLAMVQAQLDIMSTAKSGNP